MTFDLTAGELVRIGRCDGKCLLALETRCDCKCKSAFHGLLADIPLASVAPMSANVSRPFDAHAKAVVAAEAAPGARAANAVARLAAAAPRTAGGHISASDVSRIVDLFAQGVSVRSIAQEIGASESTVRKRLKGFETTGATGVLEGQWTASP